MHSQTISFIVASLLALASADTISITDPVASTTWQPSQQATVKWNYNTSSGKAIKTIDVELAYGDANNAHSVAMLGSADRSKSSLSFTVPKGLESGSTYFIRMWGNRGTPQEEVNFSHTFQINGTSSTTTPSGAKGVINSLLCTFGVSCNNSTSTKTGSGTTPSPTSLNSNSTQNGTALIYYDSSATLVGSSTFVAALSTAFLL